MSEAITYDVMGNIATMNRDVGGTAAYSYSGNQLTSISGGGMAMRSYAYDANGNATTDGRLGTSIVYNHLNLPTSFSGPDLSVAYTYDATGRKLRKASSATGTTDHVDGIQYTNGSIDFIQTEEGIARSSGGTYSYEYNLTDHLGNVRATFYKNPGNQQIEVLQRDDYYAFGLRKMGSPNSNNNKYLYNGKELQDELGQYDYGARFYDPVVGRWNVIDPLAEKMRRHSPYNYAFNNPIRFVDPDGMAPDDYVFDENGDFKRIDRNDEPDKLVVENSKTGKSKSYDFSDPENDTKQIEDGTIKRVTFVSKAMVIGMVASSGAMSQENRDDKVDFASEEGKGGGDLDFSYTTIPAVYKEQGASANPLKAPSSTLFLVEGESVAQNHMNFGNFLFGAAGYSLGFSKPVLGVAGHINSLLNPGSNQYSRQFDSADDQASISQGASFALRELLRYRSVRQNGTVTPVKINR